MFTEALLSATSLILSIPPTIIAITSSLSRFLAYVVFTLMSSLGRLNSVENP